VHSKSKKKKLKNKFRD